MMIAYVVDHAADHDEDCSADDYCECSFAARNAAVNKVCKWLDTLPQAAS